MCIHEQLETLHDTMSAHMKTYKMWMFSKTSLRVLSFFLKARQKKWFWGLFNHNTSFYFVWEQSLEYITLYKFSHKEFQLSLPVLVSEGMEGLLCRRLTLGSLEPLVWYFPAGSCFPRSGTGPGSCTCLLEWWRRRQSSARWGTPGGQTTRSSLV